MAISLLHSHQHFDVDCVFDRCVTVCQNECLDSWNRYRLFVINFYQFPDTGTDGRMFAEF